MQGFSLLRTATAVAAALSSIGAAQAADGIITSFSASASQVTIGTWVDFRVEFSLSAASETLVGGSDPVGPAPQDGYQEWTVNWYSRYSETVLGLSLQAGGQSFSDYPYPYLSPGSGLSGSWNFSLYFDQVGRHEILLTGDWAADANSEYGAEVATRNCYYSDPENSSDLWCDGWSWDYPQSNDNYSIGGPFASQSISIEVSAVPEPGTVALWLAGAGLLGASRLRRA